MKLTKKLISYIYRAISSDPAEFLAIRLRHGSQMTWSVSDGILTTVIPGASGLSIDLSSHTIRSLTNFLAAQPGYSVEYAEQGSLANLSALALVEGTGDQNLSNGDHITAYTSLLWSYLESYSKELDDQSKQIDEAIKQMNMLKAESYWLDEWGGYYAIPRISGESDPVYANRIIAEILRPRGNNIALANVASAVLGEKVVVRDVVEWGSAVPKHNGTVSHNGVSHYNSSAAPIYGLFDVDYAYNLESAVSITAYATLVADAIEKYRDAGTHLRSLNLLSSTLTDVVGFSATDSGSISITYGIYHNGQVVHSGVSYSGGATVLEVM